MSRGTGSIRFGGSVEKNTLAHVGSQYAGLRKIIFFYPPESESVEQTAKQYDGHASIAVSSELPRSVE